MTEQQIRDIVNDELGKMIKFSQRLTGQTLIVPKKTKFTKYKNFVISYLEWLYIIVLLTVGVGLLIKLFI